MLSRDRSDIVKDNIFCAEFFFSSFNSSDGTDLTTVGRVVSPRSTMVHLGFRVEGCRKAKKLIDNAKQHLTPHCWLPDKAMYIGGALWSFG